MAELLPPAPQNRAAVHENDGPQDLEPLDTPENIDAAAEADHG